MTMDQVLAFETTDIGAMSGAQVDAMFAATPIMLDLNGDGISTVAAQNGVQFDINATGTEHQVGWVAPTDGLLAMDRNGDGQIADGSELFGSGTTLESGQRAGNRYAALAEQDTNADGKITASDANFDQMKVWVDANQDAVTDAGELQSLQDLQITELNLNATVSTEINNGNRVGLVSSYGTEDGASHTMADVWVAKQPVMAPDLADVVVPAQDDVLGDKGADTSPATTSPEPVEKPVGVDPGVSNDELQHLPLF